MDFLELKRRSDDGSMLKQLRGQLRFNIGTWRQTRLNVLGARSRSTLLTDGVRQKHASRLRKQFAARWGKLSDDQQHDRLRLCTILDCVCELDPPAIMERISRFEAQLLSAFQSAKGIEVIGVFEIEIVNLDLMARQAATAKENEARKLHVLKNMRAEAEPGRLFDDRPSPSAYALVHFHGVVDLGINGDAKAKLLADACRKNWKLQYQFELKRFFRDKALTENLSCIAAYLVKGGNENLIYKIGFGRDSIERVEASMQRSRQTKLDEDYTRPEDPFSLTIREIEVLGTTIDRLMDRTRSKNIRNGYLFRHGQHIRR